MERRSAIHPKKNPGLTISGTGKELEILDLLQRFDMLPSHYISAWCGTISAARNRVTRLIDGHYIHILEGRGVPCRKCATIHPFSEDAWLFARMRNLFYPLSLWPRGKVLLAKRGLWVDRDKQSDQFDHKMFRSIVDWSFAFGAKQAGLKYETLDDILPRAPWKPSKEDTDPTHIPVQGMSDLIPDSFVKIEGSSSFFAHIEIDNDTETQFSKGAENTIQGKVRRYAQYLKRRDFYKRYGLPKITILLFFNKKGRVETFKEVVAATVKEADIRQRFAALYVPDFREDFPPPTGWALTSTYERVGEPLNIMEIVDVDGTGRKSLRASEDNQGGRSRVSTADGRRTEARPTL